MKKLLSMLIVTTLLALPIVFPEQPGAANLAHAFAWFLAVISVIAGFAAAKPEDLYPSEFGKWRAAVASLIYLGLIAWNGWIVAAIVLLVGFLLNYAQVRKAEQEAEAKV